MKASLVAVLVAVFCVGRVRSLWCYRCESEPSNFNCLRPVKCAETAKYCITTTQTGNNSEYRLSKRCEDMCPDTQVDLKPGAPSTNCCNFSFCNMSGATSVKTSTAAVALGIVASFFFIFQSRL